jgi:single-stranded-DNA-specific exonuclease
LEAHARARLTPDDLIPVLDYDCEIPIDEAKPSLWQLLSRLEPFGAGNPKPVFISRGLKLQQPPRVMKEIHLKLRVANGAQRPQDVIGWRMAQQATTQALVVGDVLDLAFTLDYNFNPDFEGVQLTLSDFTRPPTT